MFKKSILIRTISLTMATTVVAPFAAPLVTYAEDEVNTGEDNNLTPEISVHDGKIDLNAVFGNFEEVKTENVSLDLGILPSKEVDLTLQLKEKEDESGFLGIYFGVHGVKPNEAYEIINTEDDPLKVEVGGKEHTLKVRIKRNGFFFIMIVDKAGNSHMRNFYVDVIDNKSPGAPSVKLNTSGTQIEVDPPIDNIEATYENSASGVKKLKVKVVNSEEEIYNKEYISEGDSGSLESIIVEKLDVSDFTGKSSENKLIIKSEDAVGNISETYEYNISKTNGKLFIDGVIINEINKWIDQVTSISEIVESNDSTTFDENKIEEVRQLIEDILRDMEQKELEILGNNKNLSPSENREMLEIRENIEKIKETLNNIEKIKNNNLITINNLISNIKNEVENKEPTEFTKEQKSRLDNYLTQLQEAEGKYPDKNKINYNTQDVTNIDEFNNYISKNINDNLQSFIDEEYNKLTPINDQLQQLVKEIPPKEYDIVNIESEVLTLKNKYDKISEEYLESVTNSKELKELIDDMLNSTKEFTQNLNDNVDNIIKEIDKILEDLKQDENNVTHNQIKDIEEKINQLPPGHQHEPLIKIQQIKNSATLTINFENTKGETIKNKVTLNNKDHGIYLGRTYNLHDYRIPQYIINDESQLVVDIDSVKKEVTLKYKESQSNIKILYVNDDNDEVLKEEVILTDINTPILIQTKNFEELRDYRIVSTPSLSFTPQKLNEEIVFKYKHMDNFKTPAGQSTLGIRHIDKHTGLDLTAPIYTNQTIGDSIQIMPIPFQDYKYDKNSVNNINIKEGVNNITLKYEKIIGVNPEGPAIEDKDDKIQEYKKEYPYLVEHTDKNGIKLSGTKLGKAIYGSTVRVIARDIKNYKPDTPFVEININGENNKAIQYYSSENKEDQSYKDKIEDILTEGNLSDIIIKDPVTGDIIDANPITIEKDGNGDYIIKDKNGDILPPGTIVILPDGTELEVGDNGILKDKNKGSSDLDNEEENNWEDLTDEEIQQGLVRYKTIFKTQNNKILRVSDKKTSKGNIINLIVPEILDNHFLIGTNTKTVIINEDKTVITFIYREEGKSEENKYPTDKEIEDIIKDIIENNKESDIIIKDKETGDILDYGNVSLDKNENGDYIITDQDGKPLPPGLIIEFPDGSQAITGPGGKIESLNPDNNWSNIFDRQDSSQSNKEEEDSDEENNNILETIGGNITDFFNNKTEKDKSIKINSAILPEEEKRDKNNKIEDSTLDKLKRFIKPKAPEIDIDNPASDVNGTINPMLNNTDHISYITGDNNGYMRPSDPVTREETVTIIYRILDSEFRDKLETPTSKFTDVPNDRWSSKFIDTLSEIGIVKGKSPTQFAPTDKLTRAEAASLLVRFSNKEVDTTSVKLTDIKGHWAENDIKKAYALGWISGYDEYTYKPNNNITRAELVSIVNKMLERNVTKDNIVKGIKQFPDVKESDWFYEDIVEATNNHKHDKIDENEIWTKLLE